MPELLGRSGTGLPTVGATIKQIFAKHVHMKGFVLVYTCFM